MIRFSLVILITWLLITGAFARSGKKEHPAPVAGNPYPNSHFVTIDSFRIHYRIWNDSLTNPKGKILLIHGFTGSTFCYRKNTEALAKAGYQVVAVDLPSFGYSDRDPGFNQSNSSRARLLWDLLDRIDGEKTGSWDICGHSMGGGIAEAMAILEPSKTRSLIIVAGMVFHKSSNLTNTVSAAGKNRYVKRYMVETAERNYLTYNTMRRLLKSAYGRPPDSTEVLGYLQPLLTDGTAEAVFGIWTNAKEIVKMDIESLQGKPVLIVWGTRDKWIGKGKGKRFHEAIPGSELKLIDGAGHILIETHSEEFNAILTGFLETR